MPISAVEAVKRIAPTAKANYLEAIRKGGPLFAEHGITTPLRLAHFLAQALHETGGFTVLRENMSYTAPRLLQIFGVGVHSAAVTPAEANRIARNQQAIAERVYGLGNPRKARELGNTEAGDGFRYRGNGVLQTTGRGNHRRMGEACGLDLEGDPDLATTPEHALKPALHEWTAGGLNVFADRNDIRTITRRINGGFIGLPEREKWLNKIFPLLKDKKQDTDPSAAGDPDDTIRRLQEDLNDLGANPRLDVDGRFGPGTRKAVKKFQTSVGLVADGIPGPVTEAAIKLRLETIRGR